MTLLSNDMEEFDVPREHGVDFSLEEGMKVIVEGINRIHDLLKKNEMTCHGVDHWKPKETDFARSKEIVENMTRCRVYSYLYNLSLILSIWLVGGVILIYIGVTGVYIAMIYTEVKHRPLYNIQNILD